MAKTNPRTHAPVVGSLTQSVLALVVLVVFAIAGAGQDVMFPVFTLFTWLTNTGAFGLVMLMALTSFAVIGYFRSEPHGLGKWTTLVAPLIAGIALVVLFGAIVANFDVLIGLEGASVLGWLLPTIVVVPGILGLLWAFKLRSTQPAVYARVGHGGDLADDETDSEQAKSQRSAEPKTLQRTLQQTRLPANQETRKGNDP